MGTPGRARNQGLIPVRLRAAAEAELRGAAGGVQRDRPAMFSSRVDGSMLIAAGAVDHRLEPKRRDFAECREGSG